MVGDGETFLAGSGWGGFFIYSNIPLISKQLISVLGEFLITAREL